MKVKYNSTFGEIRDITGGTLLHGSQEAAIETITTDSRELGDKSLFVPLAGEKFDGHQFIEALVKEKKISGFLTMRGQYKKFAEDNDSNAVLCDDTLRAYGRIASHHRDKIKPFVIGITGSSGKTTTKEILSSIISMKYGCLKNEKNFNNEIGVPFTLLGLSEEHRMAVVEMGMNHAGELDRLTKISKPDLALITNVGEGHLEFLGSVENVAHAKSEIMNSMKKGQAVFLNRDTRCFDIQNGKALEMGLKVITFGLDNSAGIYPDSYSLTRDDLEIAFRGEVFRVPLYGLHNVYNCMAALAVALELDIETGLIKEAFENFKNIKMRSEIIQKEFVLIDDTYNSNPLSAKYALISIDKIFGGKRKIAVLSDMKELGNFSEQYHRELGRQVVQNNFDLLLLWGDMSRYAFEGAKSSGMKTDSLYYFEDKKELIDMLKRNISKDDVILIKGSRSMKMEEVVDAIVR